MPQTRSARAGKPASTTGADPAGADSDGARSSRRGPYRKTAARQQDILDAALAVFGRSGYRSGSIREIADAVGISQAGLLHHFESKDALLTAVLRHRDDLSKALYSDPRGVGTLLSTIQVVRFNMQHRGVVELHCVLSAEATAADHPAHRYFADRYSWLRSVFLEAFERMEADGQLRAGVEPVAAARSALALMDGLQVQWLLDTTSVDMVADIEAYFRQVATEEAWPAGLIPA
jgi:AcrR family transcriptional regulator